MRIHTIVCTYLGDCSTSGRFPEMQCSISDEAGACSREAVARAMCLKHYKRWRNHGEPTAPRRTQVFTEEDFWARVNKTDTCWLWTGKTNTRTGPLYGTFGKRLAHRVSFVLANGRLPKGDVDHLCRVTLCVRPEHLEDVTARENRRRASTYVVNGACRRGHPLSEENTYLRPNGSRMCRVCARRKSS